MYKLRQEEDAKNDREQIIKYILSEYHVPSFAKKVRTELNKGFSRIKRQPYIYPVTEFDTPKKHEYRRLHVLNYVAFYRVDEENKQVIVSRIFHERQNYESRLN
jgi:addiction module RelE/StbE family toxin